MKKFAGSGLGGSGSSHTQPDTFFTDDLVEIVLGLTEGPIKGLKDNSAKNFFIGDTPLLNANGEQNYTDFKLDILKGSSVGELIIPRLGGQTSSTDVNTQLAYNVPVTRQGTQTNIDWLELRFVINQLVAVSDDGNSARDLKLKIEYKQTSDSTWLPGVLYTDTNESATDSNNVQSILQQGDQASAYSQARQQVIYDQSATPDPTSSERLLTNAFGHRVLWIDTADGTLSPQYFSNDAFYAPNNVSVAQDKQSVTFDDPNYIGLIDPNRGDVSRTIFYWTTGVPGGARVGDLWYNPSSKQTLWFNGVSWVATLSPSGRYNIVTGQNVVSTNGIITIHEKISSNAVKELRIAVSRVEDTYDVRVTKLTQDDADLGDDRADVTFESIQEVTAEPMRFPNLACAHISGQATDQFNSLPQLSGVYEGRTVKVPSNYDPDTRTYSGTWDGTWKVAYSNNPAYIGYDLVENDRYGMSSTYPVTLEPEDVYEAGVWCDQLRGSDNKPQFTFNQLISDAKQPREMATYVFGIFGGRFVDDGNGYAHLYIDNDKPASHLFTKENVKNGIFKYSYTEAESRKNDLTVEFKNPQLRYKKDRRRVFDQNMIDTYGRVPDNFEAIGCNSAAEAIYRARVKLISDQTETETVTFDTAREGLYLAPYEIILVADDGMDDTVISGRIAGVNGRTLTLRDNIYLEAGTTYQLVINLNSFDTATIDIDASSTGVATKTILLAADLPGPVPDQAVFSINQDTKAYRVITIAPSDGENGNGDDESVTITAIEVNRTKYADAADGMQTIDVKIPEFSDNLAAVTNLKITPKTELRYGRIVQNLVLTWDPHPNKFVRSYTIRHKLGSNSWVMDDTIRTNHYEISDVEQGRYVVSVQATTLFGQHSIIAFADVDLTGVARKVEDITDLTLTNQTGLTGDIHSYEEVDAKLQWKPGADDPALHAYRIEVYNDIDTLLRTETVNTESYIYSLSDHIADGATRQVKISVTAIDLSGNEAQPVSIIIKNPAPLAPVVNTTNGFGHAEFNWLTDISPDYQGTLVWISTSAGIDPTSRPADRTMVGNQLILPLDPGETRYVVVALFDSINRDELNYSAEVSAKAYQTVDTDPPAVPTGLALSQRQQDNGDGTVSYFLTATWDANTESDFATYYVRLKGGSGNFISFSTSEASYEWKVIPGQTYQVNLSAADASNNKSNLCATKQKTITGDTTPPAVPMNPNASGGFGTIWYEFDGATDPDLKNYEVYVSDTNTAPDANAVATYVTASTTLPITGLADGVTKYLWVRSVDLSGNKSAWSVVASTTTAQITAQQLDVSLDQTSYAQSLNVPKIVSSLPALPDASQPLRVSLSGTLYKQNAGGTAWVQETDASLIVGQITTGQIAASAVGADQIAANSISARHLVLTNTSNMVPDNQMQDAASWTLGDWAFSPTFSGCVNSKGEAQLTCPADGLTGYYNAIHSGSFSVEEGKTYRFTIARYADFTGISGTQATSWNVWQRAQFYDANGNPLTTIDGDNYITIYDGTDTEFSTWLYASEAITVPAGAKTVQIFTHAAHQDNQGVHICVSGFGCFLMADASLVVDGSITAAALAATNVVTQTAQIADAIITSAKVVSLDAAKLQAGTTLSGSITVDGRYSLSDPAAGINTGTTKINPGSVLISGSTYLANWIYGGDNTSINGGAIGANTVAVNKLTAGLRGVQFTGLQFSTSGNTLSWTAGTATYVDDSNNRQTVNTAAGSVTYSGAKIYVAFVWRGVGDGTYVRITTDDSILINGDHVELAVYNGGTDLTTNIGQTIIDGDHIKTGTITATQCDINSIRAGVLVANAISSSMLQANSITADKVVIQDSSNMIPDSTVSSAWSLPSPWVKYSDPGSAVCIYPGAGASGYTAPAETPLFQVVAGTAYYASYFQVRFGSTGNMWGRVHWFDQNGNEITPYATIYAGAVNAETVSARFTAPSGARTAKIKWYVLWDQSDNHVEFQNAEFRKQYGGDLIVDGSITANKISVSSLDAISANLGSIQVGTANIQDLSVNGQKIQAGAVSSMTLAQLGSAVGVASNSETAIIQTSISVSGGNSLINIYMNIAEVDQGDLKLGLYVKIYRNGSLLTQINTFVPQIGIESFSTGHIRYGGSVAMSYVDTSPGSGTDTYQVNVYPTTSSITIDQCSLAVTNLRK